MKKKIEQSRWREFEFVALMAFLMSNVAFSIDAVLPALNDIGSDLNVVDNRQLPYVISSIFIGLGVGQLVFGVLSDSWGRKSTIYLGALIFVVGTFTIPWSIAMPWLIAGRLVQGIGLAAFRTVSISIVRDSYAGDKMAKILSFIMVIFILVPMVAPLIGNWILSLGSWKYIFLFQLIFAFVVLLWFAARLPETLPLDKAVPFRLKDVTVRFREYFTYRNAVLFTLIAGLIEGVFVLYLSTSAQIFQKIFEKVDSFPYWFGGLSLILGLSTLFNGMLVSRWGMKRMAAIGLSVLFIVATSFLVIHQVSEVTFLTFLVFLIPQFLAFGFVFGNISTLAMQPVGHMAGTGASIFSFLSTLMGGVFSLVLGGTITTTVWPLFAAFAGATAIAGGLWWSIGRKTGPDQ